MPPGSPNPDPVKTKKCHFPHPFSDLEVVTKRNIRCLCEPSGVSGLTPQTVGCQITEERHNDMNPLDARSGLK